MGAKHTRYIARIPSSSPISSSSHFFFIQPLLHPTSPSSNSSSSICSSSICSSWIFLCAGELVSLQRNFPLLSSHYGHCLSLQPFLVHPAFASSSRALFHSHLHLDCSLDFRTTFNCGHTLLSQTFFQTRRVWRRSRKLDIITSPTVRPGQRKPRNPRPRLQRPAVLPSVPQHPPHYVDSIADACTGYRGSGRM